MNQRINKKVTGKTYLKSTALSNQRTDTGYTWQVLHSSNRRIDFFLFCRVHHVGQSENWISGARRSLACVRHMCKTCQSPGHEDFGVCLSCIPQLVSDKCRCNCGNISKSLDFILKTPSCSIRHKLPFFLVISLERSLKVDSESTIWLWSKVAQEIICRKAQGMQTRVWYTLLQSHTTCHTEN